MASLVHHCSARQNAPPPPYILRLPSELTIQIASYLTPRGIFALLIAIPAFSAVLYVFDGRYTCEQQVLDDSTQDSLYRIYTPLQYFCSRGDERVVQRLLETGADPNELSFDNHKKQIAPLILAIGFRSARLVSLLIAHGAWVDDRNDPEPHDPSLSLHYFYREESPLHVAVAPPNRSVPRAHDQAAYTNRAVELPRIVQLLLSEGVNVHNQNRKHHTALQIACATMDADPLIVRALVAAGSDLARGATLNSTSRNEISRRFMTRFFPNEDSKVAVIHYAANTGNAAVLRILLEAGGDVDARTLHGMRALDLGVLHMRREIVEMLVEAGADVSATIADGSGGATLLDPFEIVEEAATWDQLLEWLRLRGWEARGRSLNEWWTQGESPGANRRRIGQPEDFPGN